MKLLLRLLILSIIGLLAAACASSAVQVSPTTAPVNSSAPVAPADAQEASPAQPVSEIRPQFLNSYADWGPTGRRNTPIVNRLEEQYSDRVEFVWLNIDNSETLPMRQQYDIVGRSQYVLVAPDGSVVRRWFGYLDEASVAAEIDAYLASLGWA